MGNIFLEIIFQIKNEFIFQQVTITFWVFPMYLKFIIFDKVISSILPKVSKPQHILDNFYFFGLQVKRTDNLGRLYILIDATCLNTNSPYISLSLNLSLSLSLSLTNTTSHFNFVAAIDIFINALEEKMRIKFGAKR